MNELYKPYNPILPCQHTGPLATYSGHPVSLCQQCGNVAICDYCRYESKGRYVCQTCYYRVDMADMAKEVADRDT